MKTIMLFKQTKKEFRNSKQTHLLQTLKTLSVLVLFLVATLNSNTVFAQSDKEVKTAQNELIVKGNVSDELGPLHEANVVLKSTNIGTSTDVNGNFTFPQSLKPGDVLLVSYLGYHTAKITIKEDTSFIKIILTSEIYEVFGDLNSNKPYKSKRKN